MAKNKQNITTEASFSCINPNNTIEIPNVIDVKGNSRYVKWGKDNKLPQYLYDSFLQVSNLQSVLLTYNDYICGADIDSEFVLLNTDDETIQETVKKAVMDYLIFGTFALECIRNAHGDIVDVLYQDARNVRISEDFTTAYLASEWGSFSGKNVAELPLWDKKQKQTHFIYFYTGNSRGWYGTPLYFSALKSVEILKQCRNFHLNNLLNNFSANAIITFCNGIPSKTVQDEIHKNIENSFCGTENASRLFINFCDDKDKAPKIERLTEDKFGDLYKALADSSVEDIYQACRINKMLLGANVQTGFSRQEFDECSELFNTTVIKPIQRDIEKAFQKLGINIRFNKYTMED